MAMEHTKGKWKPARHLSYLNGRLMALAMGEIKRLAVFMPPQNGKSSLCSCYFPAFYLGMFPDERIILSSYQAEFAAKWGRACRGIIQEYAKYKFGLKGVSDDSSAANRWDLAGNDGGMITAGVGGGVTGQHADLLIIDDPVADAAEAHSATMRNKHWEWYESVAHTRLGPEGKILLVMTRWHRDDLAGRILVTQEDANADKWEVVQFKAIADGPDVLGRKNGEPLWPEMWPLSALEQIRASKDRYWWESQYQQTPTLGGISEWPETFFNTQWFEEWPGCSLYVITLDPSKGKESKVGDYSAMVVVGLSGKDIYCEADIERKPTDSIVADLVLAATRWNPKSVAIETNQFQELLADRLKDAAKAMNVTMPIRKIEHSVNKELRIRWALDPLINGRRIFFKRNSPGTKRLVEQLLDFPAGEHDDGPDALEMAISELQRLTATGIKGISVGRSTVAPSHQAFQQRF